jgi:general secretion pathway protein K
MRKQQGIALVLVLWILSLLTIMAGSYALTIRREISIVSAINDNAKLKALAEAGLNVAATMLFYQDEKNTWAGDGSIYLFQFKDAEIRLRIFSESGKIDINKADEKLLLAVLKTSSADETQQQEIVDAILDWRDKDELVRINGAEEKQYRDAGKRYQPQNKDFQAIEELQLVLGMDEAIYTQLESLITVYSKQKTVDLEVASREVIMAVSTVDAELLEDFVEQRQISNRLQQQAPKFPLQSGSKKTHNNSVFTIFSEAKLADDTKAGIRATISKSKAIKNKANIKQKLFSMVDWKTVLDEKDSLFNDRMEQFLVNLDAETQ